MRKCKRRKTKGRRYRRWSRGSCDADGRSSLGSIETRGIVCWRFVMWVGVGVGEGVGVGVGVGVSMGGGIRVRRWRGGGDGDGVLFVYVLGMRRGRGVWGM